MSISIVIVDDDPFVCTSLSTILGAQDDIEVLGTATGGDEAVHLYGDVHPDLLLMDIQMPQGGGLAAAERILEEDPQARVVFLTTFSDDEYIVRALRLGAKGYLIKQKVADIAPALRSVMSGQSVLGSEVIDRVDLLMRGDGLPSSGSGAPPSVFDELTDREREVVELIAQGYGNAEIARCTCMSEGTVRNHISTILQRLGLKNRTQVAVCYYQGHRSDASRLP